MRFVPAVPFRHLSVLALGAFLYLGSVAMPQRAGAEPEVVCSWCVPRQDDLGNAGNEHHFPDPSNRCVLPKPDFVTYECSRCGGSSTCHTDYQVGACHTACGGENLASAEQQIEALIAGGDTEGLREFLATAHAGVVANYLEAGGRIELVADCAPDVVASVVAIPAEMRPMIAESRQG